MKLRLTKVLSVLLCAALIIGTQHSFINAISNSPTAEVTAGDINGDASVNNKDLTRLFQYLSDWDVSVEEDALDVNGDGAVNNKDLTRLFQYLSDWDVEIFVTSHCPHDGETEIRGIIEATCTEAGYTGDTYCTDCGALLSAGTVIEPFGHSSKDATYYKKGICENCGKEYYKDICAYDQLNESQKQIYSIIDNAVKNLEMDWINIPFISGTDKSVVESDIRVAFHAVSYDRPEYFWMPKNYVIQQFVDSFTGEHVKTVMSFSKYSNDTTRGYFNVTAAEKDTMQAELDEKIEEILALAQTYETDFEKELFLHDYLCENISYDHASADNPNNADFRAYTIYGALINGTCVCEGYSRAMQLLCNRLEIPCGLISGIGNDGPHMWNIIRIGGGLYYLDVTFDDSLENSGLEITYLHNYFNITTSQLQRNHKLDDMYQDGVNYSNPNSDFNFFETHEDATEYYYYTTVGAYIYANDASDAAQFALKKWQDGHTMVEYEFADSITATVAAKLLANELVGKLRISNKPDPLPFGNYLILVFKK